MNLKRIKILSFFCVFILTFIFHFLYDLLPNPLFAVLFPVNESIWEHMKLIYSGFVIWGLVEYLIIKKYGIKVNNYYFNLLIVSTLSILLYLVIYLPLYKIVGEVFVINILLLALIIALGELISYKLLKNSTNYKLDKISILFIIMFYIFFAYLTYYPIHNYIFYDNQHNVYGIKK